METITIKICDFEGPLDVLIYLIEKNKYSIYDINISQICNQYLDYLNKMQELNLEIASEFIQMASSLIYLKSRKLLPNQDEKEEEEITKEELVKRIVEYKKYKIISKTLRESFDIYSKRITKLPENISLPKKELEQELKIDDIVISYKNVLQKNKEKLNENYSNVEKIAIKEKYTIESKVKEMFKTLYKEKSFVFNNLYDVKTNEKEEVVTAFSGLLELSRRQKIITNQQNLFSDIYVEKFKLN